MIHQFKIYPYYYRAVIERRKTFEVRKKRHLEPYIVGDLVYLYEFDPTSDMYTGRVWNGKITYVLDDERYCKEDYVIFSIEEI